MLQVQDRNTELESVREHLDSLTHELNDEHKLVRTLQHHLDEYTTELMTSRKQIDNVTSALNQREIIISEQAAQIHDLEKNVCITMHHEFKYVHYYTHTFLW